MYQSLRNRTHNTAEGDAMLSNRGARNSVGELNENSGAGSRSNRASGETSTAATNNLRIQMLIEDEDRRMNAMPEVPREIINLQPQLRLMTHIPRQEESRQGNVMQNRRRS